MKKTISNIKPGSVSSAARPAKSNPIAEMNAILAVLAAEEARKAGKHLRLVVNNDRRRTP